MTTIHKLYAYRHEIEEKAYVFSTEKYGPCWWDANLLDIENSYTLQKAANILCERFKCIKFENKLLFKINDPADEAAFLLWSSEGIEI